MILVIDNFDSFTWNLVQYLGELGGEPEVRRNNAITVADIESMRPRAIVISPGPGTPAGAGVTLDVLRSLGPSVPILGVCLGHQAIAEAYGGKVIRAATVMHGKTSRVRHGCTGLFEGVPSPLEVMRYHSLTVEAASVPASLEVTAWGETDETDIQAIRHREHRVWGVQFHPESVMTQSGMQILANFLRLVS